MIVYDGILGSVRDLELYYWKNNLLVWILAITDLVSEVMTQFCKNSNKVKYIMHNNCFLKAAPPLLYQQTYQACSNHRWSPQHP